MKNKNFSNHHPNMNMMHLSLDEMIEINGGGFVSNTFDWIKDMFSSLENWFYSYVKQNPLPSL